MSGPSPDIASLEDEIRIAAYRLGMRRQLYATEFFRHKSRDKNATDKQAIFAADEKYAKEIAELEAELFIAKRRLDREW